MKATEPEEKANLSPEERLLTREEVGKMLGVSPRAIYDFEKRGVLPEPFRLGGIWVRHRMSTIKAYLDKLEAEAKERASK